MENNPFSSIVWTVASTSINALFSLLRYVCVYMYILPHGDHYLSMAVKFKVFSNGNSLIIFKIYILYKLRNFSYRRCDGSSCSNDQNPPHL